MKSNAVPTVHSFIIRFVVDNAPLAKEARPAYHGTIRHIQSEEEMNFNTWNDVVDFIRRYVPLETENSQGSS